MKKPSRFFLLCMTAVLVIACSERVLTFYKKYEDAAKEGAVQRGWIPEIVPKNAREIHEQHDLDTNEVWVRFYIQKEEKSRVTAGLKKLTDDEILKIKLKYPSKANWWFEGLVQQSPSNDNALNAEIYSVKCNGDGYLALERTSQQV